MKPQANLNAVTRFIKALGFHDVPKIFDFALVASVTLFVVWNLSPWLWFLDTTPTGGDLGAHVWAPAYLRDELLPNFRLTGWSGDWYAGFPAFTFYMVIPSLLVVMVNVGLPISVDVLSVLAVALTTLLVTRYFKPTESVKLIWVFSAGLASAVFGYLADGRQFAGKFFGWSPIAPVTFNDTAVDTALTALLLPTAVAVLVWTSLKKPSTSVLQKIPLYRWRGALTSTAVMATLLAITLPYGVSIKLVVVTGMVTLPLAAYICGRLAGLQYPGPALLALMTLPFIFDRSFNIYGGNLLSTMAGEFAYSLGLTVAVLFVGVAARGLNKHTDKVLAALLLALTGLLHLFAAFFALVAFAALLLVRFGRREVVWVGLVGTLAAMVSAFWVLPFAWNVAYLNDMGWGKERRYAAALWHRGDNLGDQSFLANQLPLQIFVVLALLGAVICVRRKVRLGLVLAIVALVFAVAFVALPESRLWNVRILPFYYLAIYLLAGVAIGELCRSGSRVFRTKDSLKGKALVSQSSYARTHAILVTLFAVLILTALAFPLRAVPFASEFQRDIGEGKDLYGFESFFGIESVGAWQGLATAQVNPGPGWLRYNFTGYERKVGTAEYNDLVATMADVGANYGCGRSLWEYNSERLGTYGTTMAPMLLPHWTQGCIASMEGLYFEASATTPYHFLLQSELSEQPSRAQRDLPYSPLNVTKGVRGLQTLGVRYYLAVSEAAIAQARSVSELTEIAQSGPWVVFLVDDTDLVLGLDHLPVVVEGTDAGGEHWLVPTAALWESPSTGALIAASGPPEWPRLSLNELAEQYPDVLSAQQRRDRSEEIRALAEVLPEVLKSEDLSPTEVTDLVANTHSLSFQVAEVGKPVLVKTSYFPNWRVEGAAGPYRVAPNLMAVVPTERQVTLTYARSNVQIIGWLATILGLAALLILTIRKPSLSPVESKPFWDLGKARERDSEQHQPSTLQQEPSNEIRLSVVVPAYCEAQRIAKTVTQIRASLTSLDQTKQLEIVVVDDGSDDDTASIARDAGADLVIVLPKNCGKGAAVRAGVVASQGRTIAFTDADLAYDPHQLLPLLHAVEDGNDVVIGNRYARQSLNRGDISGLRRLGSRVVNLVARIVLKGRYQDTQCGCKAFRDEPAKTLMKMAKIDGFAFDVEILYLAEQHHYKIAEVPVTLENNGSSSVKAVRDGIRVVLDILKVRRLAKSGQYVQYVTSNTGVLSSQNDTNEP